MRLFYESLHNAIKNAERVKEQVVVEVLVQVEQEGHVPVSQQEHARPLYVENLWIQLELCLQEEVVVEGVGPDIDQLAQRCIKALELQLLALHSDKAKAPDLTFLIQLFLLLVEEDEVLQENDICLKTRTFPQI